MDACKYYFNRLYIATWSFFKSPHLHNKKFSCVVVLLEIGSNMTKTSPAGEDVSLPCNVRDGVHAKWMRGQQELLPAADGLLPSELRGRLLLRQRGRRLQELVLRNAAVNDSNVYTCLAGSVRHVIHLRIVGKSSCHMLFSHVFAGGMDFAWISYITVCQSHRNSHTCSVL